MLGMSRAPAGISGSHGRRFTSGSSAIASTGMPAWQIELGRRATHRGRRRRMSSAKFCYLRPHYHFGPGKVADYLKRFHSLSIACASVHRILRKHGMNRLPANQKYRLSLLHEGLAS